MEVIEQLKAEAAQIQKYIELVVNDSTEMRDRLSVLNSYIARTGVMLSDAKYLQDKAITAAYAEQAKLIMKMAPTVALKYINSITAEENHLVSWIDRLNKGIVHISDNIRTQLSYSKEEMKLTRTGY